MADHDFDEIALIHRYHQQRYRRHVWKRRVRHVAWALAAMALVALAVYGVCGGFSGWVAP